MHILSFISFINCLQLHIFMGLEEQLFVRRYFVTEECSEIIPLGNDFGDISTKLVSKKEYGSYISEARAEIKIQSLRTKRLKEGWKTYNEGSGDLLKEGKQDLWMRYFVQEKFIPCSKK